MTVRARTRIARRLRRDGTDAERLLWRALREAVLPWRFRRQHPIGGHIADFACPAAKLVIEIDGGQHAAQQAADAARSASLAAHGYRVIRFWNNEVLGNCAGVQEQIRDACAGSPTSPRPSPPPGAERGQC